MTRLTITEQNNNEEVRLRVGDELIVKLDFQPGTGYDWIKSGDDEGVLRQFTPDVKEVDKKESDIEESAKRDLGGVEPREFYFRAVSSGIQEIELEYRRPWEKSETSTKFFSFIVISEE